MFPKTNNEQWQLTESNLVNNANFLAAIDNIQM